MYWYSVARELPFLTAAKGPYIPTRILSRLQPACATCVGGDAELPQVMAGEFNAAAVSQGGMVSYLSELERQRSPLVASTHPPEFSGRAAKV